jgi:hypothetical protein
MKRILIALLVVSLFSSASFAANAGKFGMSFDNVSTNLLAGAALESPLAMVPTVGLLYQFNNQLSASFGYGSGGVLLRNKDKHSLEVLCLRGLWNFTTAPSTLHVGVEYLTISTKTVDSSADNSSSVSSAIAGLIGGEVAIGDNASLTLDCVLATMFSSSYTPKDDEDVIEGNGINIMPQIGFRLYI